MRDKKIDLLRFIGLMMIILAHTVPPKFLAQVRNFDVPLMVFVSAVTFSKFQKKETYFSYLYKRLKRLVLPVWVFLTFYFIWLFVLNPSSDKLNF